MAELNRYILTENVITSKHNPTVKRICSLEQKKKRREEGLFRFDGLKLFCEAVRARVEIELAVVAENASEAIFEAIANAIEVGSLSRDSLLAVSDEVFKKISEEMSPEGIITVAHFLDKKHKSISPRMAEGYCLPVGERIILAESVRDAGNLGTLIRTCKALGIERLVLSDDCADLYNSKTIRAAMGGLFDLNIDLLPTDKMAQAIFSLRKSGRKIYATALHREALRIGELQLSTGDAFVIGNEGHGLSQNVIAACDGCAVIPMCEGSESLNAAVAAAICIWETVK